MPLLRRTRPSHLRGSPPSGGGMTAGADGGAVIAVAGAPVRGAVPVTGIAGVGWAAGIPRRASMAETMLSGIPWSRR